VAEPLLRIDDLRRRVQKDSASLAFAQLGEELRRAGELDEAIRVCRAGLEWHPEYVSARVTLGRALLASNALDDAFNELSGVLLTAPENLAALRGLGETHQRRGDLPAALGVFRRALALAPHDAELAALVSAIQPSVPGNGDSRRWPPPSGSHPIVKPSQQQKTGPHSVANVTSDTGRHTPAKPGPIGLPVNEIDVRQPADGDVRTAALDLLGAPLSDAERDHAALDSETSEPSDHLHAVETPSSTLQQERDLHELLASLPMADDQITPDAREMLASWSVAPIETMPAPVEEPPVDLVASPAEPPFLPEPPPLPLMLATEQDARFAEPMPPAEPTHPLELTAAPDPAAMDVTAPAPTPELTLTSPTFTEAPPDPVLEPPTHVPVEPSAAQDAVLPFPARVMTEQSRPIEPELNPIEAAQVALLERWLESIKAARAQDHDTVK